MSLKGEQDAGSRFRVRVLHTMLRELAQLWREEGLAGFFRGYKWAVLRAFPANGAAMVGIEVANRMLAARATTT